VVSHRHFKAALKKAGLPQPIRFHDLRHSRATLLIAQGVHPRVVMEILRYSQISTTMNTYAHVLPASSATRQRRSRRCSTGMAKNRRTSRGLGPL
jgi:site-specific recombinase XerD